MRIDGQFLGNQDDARSLMRPLLEHPAALHASIREESFFDAVFVSNDFLHDPAPATLRPHRIASDIGEVHSVQSKRPPSSDRSTNFNSRPNCLAAQ
ncbi:hypothetical protein I551_8247 [Mycobacterium ulcerans str. Harvey]|uniref:Uncharacterized protein n=1 Tax=Mycobacterium ulcerans str. Harvey TaxID=1299332 RepID=A0ABN0QL07_MYCUL|nr:hypothetical protein I551_8247 [Mycobacterium ulcerans str. Harvey]